MAKGTRGRRRISSRQCRPTPYPLPSVINSNDMHAKNCPKMIERKGWQDATCSVCMEYPHNAVLLLCSSHDKGCRPYMCGTSSRYSNCLDQYKKAYTKVTSSHHSELHQDLVDSPAVDPLCWPVEKCEFAELACPLCRGQVKGWTVFEPAREYLNTKKRSCMQEKCSFIGTYKELRKHVKAEHPSAKPREVDPLLEQKWRRLENEREREDVISTIRSSMPGAVVFGDYVIEGSHYSFDSEEEDDFAGDATERSRGFELGIDSMESNLMNFFLFLQRIGSAGDIGSNRGMRWHDRDSNQTVDGNALGISRATATGGFDYSDEDSDADDSDGRGNDGISLVNRLRRQSSRVFLGRSGRRRRRREANGSQR